MSSPASAVPSRSATLDLWILLALTVAGAALRFYQLGGKSLWFDEAVIYHIVQGGWRDILALNATDNSAPPLYPLVLGFLTGPGASEATLRTLSAVIGVGAIPAIYVLAREFTGSRFALLAALLMAFSPTQVWFSQQLREYSLAVVAATLLIYAYVRFIRAPGPRTALVLAALAAFGLLVQYGIAFLLVALNAVCVVALWWAADRRRVYALWAMSQVPAGIVALLLALLVLPTQLAVVSLGTAGYLQANYWDGSLADFLDLLSAENDLFRFAYPGLLALGLTLLGTGAFLLGRGSGLAAALLLVPTAFIFVLALVGWYPYGAVRQDLFLTPMIYVCAAIGLAVLADLVAKRLSSLVTGGLAALGLAALLVYGLEPSVVNLRWEGREPMRPFTQLLAEKVQPGDTIYVYDRAVPAFRYYWRDRSEPWIQGSPHWSGLDERLAASQMTAVQDELLKLMARRRPFWVVITAIIEPDAVELLDFLSRSAEVHMERGQPGTWLLRVTPRGNVPLSRRP